MLEKSSPYSPDLIIDAKKAMKKDCYFLVTNIYSKEFCEEIKSNIDNINSNVGVEINYVEQKLEFGLLKKIRCSKTIF